MAYSPLGIFSYVRHKKRRFTFDVTLSNIDIRKNHPNPPHKIQIEHTTSCNFKCITCSRMTWSNANPMDPRLNKNMKLPDEKEHDVEDRFMNSTRVKSIETKKIIDEKKVKYSNKKSEISRLGQEKIMPRCTWLSASVSITTKGYVIPYCLRPDLTVINFGNINEKSFEEIWNSPQYVDSRKSMAVGESNPICNNYSS
jgi:MoaA/NifB/PqqE/SkfB family radical SAM enzyme